MKLTFEHTNYTIGEVAELQDAYNGNRRTTHVGNVPPRDLLAGAISTLYPHEIQANDSYTSPLYTVTETGRHRFEGVSKKGAKKLASYMVFQLTKGKEEGMVIPNEQSSVGAYHFNALQAVMPEDRSPEVMLRHLQQDPVAETLRDHLLQLHGENPYSSPLQNHVTTKGKLAPLTAGDSVTPSHYYGHLMGSEYTRDGLLIPLEAQMALDALVLACRGDSESVHLAGQQMGKYTRDSNMQEKTAKLFSTVTEQLGMQQGTFNYRIQDCQNLDRAYQEAVGHTLPPSQHATNRQEISTIYHAFKKTYTMPCGISQVQEKQ